MKLGKLLALIAVLTVLVSAAIVKKVAHERREAELRRPAAASQSPYAGLTASFVDGVTLYKGKDAAGPGRVVLSKTPAGEWKVASHGGVRAAKGAVEPFLKAIGEMKGEPRAQSASVLEDFKLTDDQAVHVELSRPGGEPAHLLVSPVRPGPRGNFLRDRGSDTVLETQEDLLSRMGIYTPDAVPNYKSFADLQVLPMDISKVERAEISAPGQGRLALVRQGEAQAAVWSFDPAESAVDKSKVTSFLANVSNLYAADVPATAPAFPAAPAAWITVKEKEAPAREIELGPLDPERKAYLVRVRPEELVYFVPESAVDALKKDKSFFKAAS